MTTEERVIAISRQLRDLAGIDGAFVLHFKNESSYVTKEVGNEDQLFSIVKNISVAATLSRIHGDSANNIMKGYLDLIAELVRGATRDPEKHGPLDPFMIAYGNTLITGGAPAEIEDLLLAGMAALKRKRAGL